MKKTLFIILTALLIFSLPCWAAIEWVKYEYFDLAGGLNNGLSEISIEDNEASDIQNIVFTESGSMVTRDGYAKLNSTTLGASVSTTGITYYSPTSGSKYVVGVFSDDKVRKMDYAGASGPDGTWDDITGALSFANGQNDLASFTVGEDELIIEDGINTTAPYKWTGSGNATALGGSPPNATMVAFHKNMAFLAGNDTYPSTLYFSDIGDIENWSTGLSGNISIETNDGTKIRAIAVGYDSLYIWKDRSIWRLSGNDKDSFELQRMIIDIGCVSSKVIGIIGNSFIFQDIQGDIYLYDGALKVENISVKIDGTIGLANFSRFQYSCAVVFNSDFYLSISEPGISTNSVILFYDTFNSAWSKFSGINANAMCVIDDGTGEDILIFGDYGGFVYKYPYGTDDAGTAISSYYITKQFRFPEIAPLKDLKLLRIFADEKGNYDLYVDIFTDFESTGAAYSVSLLGSSSVYGTAIYGVSRYGGTNIIIGRIENNEEASFFKIKFYNTTQPFELKGFQCFMQPSDRI